VVYKTHFYCTVPRQQTWIENNCLLINFVSRMTRNVSLALITSLSDWFSLIEGRHSLSLALEICVASENWGQSLWRSSLLRLHAHDCPLLPLPCLCHVPSSVPFLSPPLNSCCFCSINVVFLAFLNQATIAFCSCCETKFSKEGSTSHATAAQPAPKRSMKHS
jgi:hypothetical protein